MSKTYLTPTERRQNQSDRALEWEDTDSSLEKLGKTGYKYSLGFGERGGSLIKDIWKGEIMGDKKYQRDWSLQDGFDALGILPVAKGAQMAKPLVGKGKNLVTKGVDKVRSIFGGGKKPKVVKKKKPPHPDGPDAYDPKKKPDAGKKDLDNPEGKPPGRLKRTADWMNKHPKTTIGVAAGGALVADALGGEVMDRQKRTGQPKTSQNDPTGQTIPGLPMTGLGDMSGWDRQNTMQGLANAMPQQIARRGGSGSTMTNLAQGRAQAEADRLMDIEIQKAKGTYDPTYSEDPDYFMKQRYESTGGRAAGDWDALTPEQKREKTAAYQKNSYYDSSSKEGRAADKALADSGWTAPRQDRLVNAARAELGMPSAEQSRLDELDRRAGLTGPGGSFGPEGPAGHQTPQQWGGGNVFVDPNDPTNENKRPGQVSRDEFMDKSGMQTPGTGLTQNPDGTYNTLEFGDTYEQSGGDKSAEEYLVGPQGSSPQIEGGHAKLANLQHQANDQSVTMADGHSNPLDDLSEGTRRLSSDMQDYGDAAFKNKADALGYLNRQAPTVDEPAPAPAPEEPAPEEPAPWKPDIDWRLPGGIGLGSALLYAVSRGKIKPKQAQKLLGNKAAPKQLTNRRLNRVPEQQALPLKPAPKQLGNRPAPQQIGTRPNQLGNRPTPKRLEYNPRSRARYQPQQGPGVPKMTEKNARNLLQHGRNPDGSVATKEQRIAAMRYLRENRL